MEEPLLVRRGTPAAVDDELDPVVRGIGRGAAQGTEERRIELGDTRDLVVEDRRAVGDGTVGLAERTAVLAARSRRWVVRPARVEDEDPGDPAAEERGDRRDDDAAGRRPGPSGSESDRSLFVLVRCRSRRH